MIMENPSFIARRKKVFLKIFFMRKLENSLSLEEKKAFMTEAKKT